MAESLPPSPSRQLLAAIVDSSDDAIITKDLNGIITSWNEGACRIFGYTSDEMIGQSVLTLIPPNLHNEEKVIIDKLKRGERIEHFETFRRAKDGRLLEISLTVSPLRNEEGIAVGASKIARDVTERKQIERALTAAKTELQSYAEQLEKKVEERTLILQRTIGELEAFSYSLTHDLRAPLRAVQSFLQILLEDHGVGLKEEAVFTVNKAINSTQRMDRMILELLAFTRISHEDMPVDPIDVEKVVRCVIEDRGDFAVPKPQIEIESPLEKVMGNQASLVQCLSNLVDNAVKFVAPGVTPHVRIYSRRLGQHVRLYVEDNGIGVSPDEQNQLFRMFNRLHGSRYAGTGIGLAIVRKAVERMGGTVGVESTPGAGTRFWLQLPSVV